MLSKLLQILDKIVDNPVLNQAEKKVLDMVIPATPVKAEQKPETKE
jgi:hypothetical protein